LDDIILDDYQLNDSLELEIRILNYFIH